MEPRPISVRMTVRSMDSILWHQDQQGQALSKVIQGGTSGAAVAGGALCAFMMVNPELWWTMPACAAGIGTGLAVGSVHAAFQMQDGDRCLSTCDGEVPPVAHLGLWCGGCSQ